MCIRDRVYSLLLAFASINLKADQTIGGTALNLLATAVAVVISKNFSDSGSAKLNYSNKPFLFLSLIHIYISSVVYACLHLFGNPFLQIGDRPVLGVIEN